MQVRLVVNSGKNQGHEINIDRSKFVVGRSSSCNLSIDSRSLSRQHCAIVIKKHRVFVYDLGSRNGTTVRGETIEPKKAYRLRDGDDIQLGKYKFSLKLEEKPKKALKKPVAESTKEETTNLGSVEIETLPESIADGLSTWTEELYDMRRVRDPEYDAALRAQREREEHAASKGAEESATSETTEPETKAISEETTSETPEGGESDEEKTSEEVARDELRKKLAEHRQQTARGAAKKALGKLFGDR